MKIFVIDLLLDQSMKAVEGALRLTGFDKPTVWTIMTPLAIKTESANLVILKIFRGKDSLHGNLQIFISNFYKKLLEKVIINMYERLDH